MLRSLCFALVLLLTTLSSGLAATETWSGAIQIWSKSASDSLPHLIAPAVPVQFEMQRPARDYETFRRSFSTSAQLIQVDIDAYWNRKPHLESALIQVNVQGIAICSFYFEPWKDQKFAGGACSGFRKASSTVEQIGVTLSPR